MNRISEFWYQWKKIIISLIISIIIIFGIILGFIFHEGPSLNAMGSTTVLPLFESISQKYYQDTKGKITVSPGGSTVGLKLIQQNNFLNFGNASRYPRLNNDEYNSNIWKKNMSTITLGYDVIVFAINLNQTGFAISNDPSIKNNFHITTNEIYDLYTGKYNNLYPLFSSSPSDHGLTPNGTASDNSKIIVREVGSGTRDSFFNALNKYHNSHDAEQKFLDNNKITKLQLNSNGLVSQTILNTPNSFGFVSLESLNYFNNQSNIGLIPVWVDPNPETEQFNPLTSNFKQKVFDDINSDIGDQHYYFWHPLNTVININDPKMNLINNFFQNWYLDSKINITKIIDDNGYIPILGYTNNVPNKFIHTNNFLNLFLKTADDNKKIIADWKNTNNAKNYNKDTPWWTWGITINWLSGGEF